MQQYLLSIKENDLKTILITWNKQNSSLLPQGKGTLIRHGSSYMITITWGNIKTCHQQHGQNGCVQIKINIPR